MALNSNVRTVEATIEREVYKRLDRAGFAIMAGAKVNAPFRTGRLRSSLRHEVQRDPRGYRLIVGTNVPYAIYQHEGTRYIAPNPFLTNAMRDPAVSAALRGD